MHTDFFARKNGERDIRSAHGSYGLVDVSSTKSKWNTFLDFSKGISQSALPYRRSVPSWLKLNAEDVKEQIKKLGKKGMTPSQIGMFNKSVVMFCQWDGTIRAKLLAKKIWLTPFEMT